MNHLIAFSCWVTALVFCYFMISAGVGVKFPDLDANWAGTLSVALLGFLACDTYGAKDEPLVLLSIRFCVAVICFAVCWVFVFILYLQGLL